MPTDSRAALTVWMLTALACAPKGPEARTAGSTTDDPCSADSGADECLPTSGGQAETEDSSTTAESTTTSAPPSCTSPASCSAPARRRRCKRCIWMHTALHIER